ncbi:tRNA threonylcarbamoyladenosine biosynthesis protein TsaB [Candidatus Gullanella endobia]|uniref:tRNA threonylcarbamoyladenosine biosynthesis protein TsaB n=1 Tax=Candidatus Gullanella endobia TaxID=1070130 RepID=A0A143WQB9_9ENTR|nr:tRNA (adenosine(37)-N6)-threonylcarbamoyltransferase complex dimerization subunit type 1 TsaB [Candidatus Gullanella endobia]CUX95932.1 tRNA threonylcarbamoyladenosine biosynthesis protein TsaB [Candidatus Gullanella endobia]
MSTRILAIDTATEACSVALMLDNDLLLERFIFAPRKHTQYVLPMVDDLLAEANITLKNLDALAFSSGPGSFTGIRIGIGIAQGLALGANLPLISVSTLVALAEGAWRQTGIYQVLTAIDARMGEVYWAPYQRQAGVWLTKEREAIMAPEALSTLSKNLSGCWATAGTGWQTYPNLLHHEGLTLISGNTLFSNARDILSIALHYYHHGSIQPVTLVEPTYLHDKVAWKKLSDRV